MRKLFVLAVLMAALVTAPAFAAVQTVKVSGDIDSTFLLRNNFDLGLSASGQNEQHGFMTQTRLRVDADLTDQVSATVGLINERVWENDPAANSEVDLNLAYITLREMIYSPMTAVVGRQAFKYGNSLIVDSSGTNNTVSTSSSISAFAEDLSKQTAQDAIRLIFDYNPLTVELLFSKIDGNTVTEATGDNDDHDLYGINTTWAVGDELNTTVEAYFFADYDRSTQGNPASAQGSKVNSIYVPGARASANILEGLNVQGEVAWQGGTVADTSTSSNQQRRNAWAAQFISNYSIPLIEEYKPVASYVYTFVSGENGEIGTNCNGGTCTIDEFNGWNPLYENQGGGTIYNSLIDLTNLHIHSVSLQATPLEDVTTKVSWHGLWLDKDVNGTGGVASAGHASNATASNVNQFRHPGDGSTGTVALNVVGGENFVGHEFDWDTIWQYTEDVTFGVNMGIFNPAQVFNGRNADAATQAIVHGNVSF
jgi:hypothetical protein